MKYSFIIGLFLFLYSCGDPVPRRPNQHSTNNFYKEVIAQNKRLNTREQLFLERLLKRDSVNTYSASETGFWYMYNQKDSLGLKSPQPNDIVEIEYNITDIYDKEIYPKQIKSYKVDKEGLIPALQDGIKLMKKGEVVTFVIPSYRGYGVVGDENKIGVNQPIKSKVKLISIKLQNNENN